jgi:hypothetical protein
LAVLAAVRREVRRDADSRSGGVEEKKEVEVDFCCENCLRQSKRQERRRKLPRL